MSRILVAGIGNIFQGDDAFGVEVVQELARRSLPAETRVVDFGIRAYDLAYALTDGCEAAILVDAASRGQPPGTPYLIEPDVAQLGQLESSALDAHSMNVVQVLQLAESIGALPGQLYLVGCEPADLAEESGRLGLSEPVRAAIPQAIAMIESLVGSLLSLPLLPSLENTDSASAPFTATEPITKSPERKDTQS
jgi:hydrogenase maturation protease